MGFILQIIQNYIIYSIFSTYLLLSATSAPLFITDYAIQSSQDFGDQYKQIQQLINNDHVKYQIYVLKTSEKNFANALRPISTYYNSIIVSTPNIIE